MDPLSVTASIVGILAVTAKIGGLLHGTISTVKDAPRVLSALACEVQEVQAAFASLQILITSLSSKPSHRAALIQLDHLIITLTGSVLTLSELEKAIAPFVVPHGAEVPLKTRLKWTRAEGDCTKIVERLQRHKASISLMLNILQCTSDMEANRSKSSLELLEEQFLQTNQQMCRRLQNLEDAFDARSTIGKKVDTLSFISRADDATITTLPQATNQRLAVVEAVKVHFAFDDDLRESRAYRMAERNGCGHSLNSSVVRTQTWSIFSGLSLADISFISVIALPLYPEDVPDQLEFYAFGGVDPPTGSGSITTWKGKHKLGDAVDSDLPELNSLSQVKDAGLSSSNETQSVPLSSPVLHNIREDGLSSAINVSEEPPLHPHGTIPQEDIINHHPPADAHAPKDRRISVKIKDIFEAPSDNDGDDAQVGEFETVHSCKVCGEVLEEGQVFELAGNRWHIDCYQCNACSTRLDSDSNVLLIDNSSLMCEECIYISNLYGVKPEALVSLGGDHGLCSTFTRCGDCKRTNTNLRYTRTSQGIRCWTCAASHVARKQKRVREKNNRVVYTSMPSIPESTEGPLLADIDA